MVTRVKAVSNLSKYEGCELSSLAITKGVTIVNPNTKKLNKGWKGHILELLAGLETNSLKAPNGLGFELKSTAFKFDAKKNIWRPKETFAITMINENELIESSFYKSHCWEKLKSMLFCAVSWDGKNATSATLLKVTTFDFLVADDVIKQIEEDYEYIRNKCKINGFSALTGKDGVYIQARTKGAGHGSTTRAFYGRKNLIDLILKF